jgi:AraC-like DNA-binding protein
MVDTGTGSGPKFWCIRELRRLELQRAQWNRESSPRHFHDSFEVAVVTRGTQKLRCRGATHHIGPGSVIVIHPGETHSISTSPDYGCSVSLFFPDAESLRYAASTALGRSLADPTFREPVIYDPDLAQTTGRLHVLLENSDSLLEMESHSVQVAGELVSRHAARSCDDLVRKPPSKSMKLAQDYLEGNLVRNISLTELCKVTGIERFGLVRAFTRQFGLPPHAYLTQIRLLHAKNHLARGMPVSQAAIASGFADQSHLTRHFKRILGITPGTYLRARTFKTRSAGKP